MELFETIFGTLDGKEIKSYTVKNRAGMEFNCLDYGCVMTKIVMPDREGKKENIVLGFDTLEEYVDHSPFFGSVMGRISGRIKNAEFSLDGKTYHLPKNDGKNNLHGGPKGFHQVIWDSSAELNQDEVKITFTYMSPDGEEGFPGNLETQVVYTFNEECEWKVSYQAISDQRTIVNLTNHSYFNLSGNLKRTILSHELQLKSDRFLELDSELLPTGRANPVDDTVFDFRNGRRLEEGIQSSDRQIELTGGGYDHPFLLNANGHEEIALSDQETGRKLIVETDNPCVVVYSGNGLDEGFQVAGGVSAQKHLGICLETQLPPDMIEDPNFESAILNPKEMYRKHTKYSFRLTK